MRIVVHSPLAQEQNILTCRKIVIFLTSFPTFTFPHELKHVYARAEGEGGKFLRVWKSVGKRVWITIFQSAKKSYVDVRKVYFSV